MTTRRLTMACRQPGRASTLRASVLCGAAAACSGPASANMMLPSIADMVASPGFYSLWVFAIPLTALILVLVALVEALVIRRRFPGTRFRMLVGGLFLLNAATSFAGLLMAPSAGRLVSGFLTAFTLTVAAEALLLPLLPFARHVPMLQKLTVSAAMNTASYLLLGAVLVGMTYGPGWKSRDASLLESAHGTLLSRAQYGLSLDERPLREKRPGLRTDGEPAETADGGIVILRDDYVERYRPVNMNGEEAQKIRFGPGKLLGVSPDLRRAAVAVEGYLRFVDRQGKPLPSPRELVADEAPVLLSRDGSFAALKAANLGVGATWRENKFCLVEGSRVEVLCPANRVLGFSLSPASDELAWMSRDGITILDCASGKRRFIARRNHSAYGGSIAWSPDGRLLACIAEFNPFLDRAWFETHANLMTADGRKWCPLDLKLDYQWGFQPLLWTSDRL